MNRLVSAVVFSLSTALVAAPTFAAPQNSQEHKQHATQNHNDANHKDMHNDSSSHHAQDQHKPGNNNSNRPSSAWKPGNPLPSQYRGPGYKVDYTKYKKLNKPGKNEQWIKVNGDYVLTNVLNHNIIKIVPGM